MVACGWDERDIQSDHVLGQVYHCSEPYCNHSDTNNYSSNDESHPDSQKDTITNKKQYFAKKHQFSRNYEPDPVYHASNSDHKCSTYLKVNIHWFHWDKLI